jgi:molybdenum cofactor cytidylyltransferase
LRYKKVAGIVLAAGGSTRMGTPKQLLPWQGKPLVRHAVEKALAAGLDPVIVVTGFAAAEVEQALAHLPVIIARNPGWELGQSASIQCGLRKIPPACGAAIFLLTDMPQVPLNILRAELEIYQTEPVAILCPSFDGQRGNPVLFARQTFPALMNLTGDTGGRALFDRFPIRWLEWDDPAILQDIDTLEDYRDFMQGDEHDR